MQNSWTLWFFKNDKNRNWEDNQRSIITFNTVEDFWALYNHIELSSKLSAGCDYSLFKEGVKPMWEDDRNRRGGRWVINLNKSQRATFLDNFWLEVMLCLIGEAFDDHSKHVSFFSFHFILLISSEVMQCSGKNVFFKKKWREK